MKKTKPKAFQVGNRVKTSDGITGQIVRVITLNGMPCFIVEPDASGEMVYSFEELEHE